MGVVEGVGPVGGTHPAEQDTRTAVDAASLAWLLSVPIAAVVVAAIVLLGPPLGDLLHASESPYAFWQDVQWAVMPEPTEQARFMLALASPPLLAFAVVLAVRRGVTLPARVVAIGVPLAQGLLLALIVACVAIQERHVYEVPLYQAGVTHRWRYFTPPTILVALVLAAAATVVLARADLRARIARWTRETPRRRLAAVLLAVVVTAIWLLHALNTDATIFGTISHEWDPVQFPLDETYAVLNGRTPLVDFTAQYGSLWPYAIALQMLVLGKSFLAFSVAMSVVTAVALLALYAVLRRVTRNAVTALLLYLPLLATSLFMVGGTMTSRYTFGDYFGIFPLRYAGPFLLAWLVVRHLDRERAGRPWPLFAVAGLVVLNNAEFGVPALVATVAALLWTARDLERRALGRLAGQLAIGLAVAYALVAALTLVRAGGLPQLGRLLDYARAYGSGGFGLSPLQNVLGLHVVIYLTYVAGVGTATVRALERTPNRPLTGLLVWSSAFGLGTGMYFAGRSHPELVIAGFPVWALTLALLLLAIVQRLGERPAMRPRLGTFLVLVGMGLTVCSLAQTPAPWTQLSRLQGDRPAAPLIEGEAPLPPFEKAFLPDPSTGDFFAAIADGPRFYVKDGAPVAILVTTGHQIADAVGVVNVSRYTGMYSMVMRERLEAVLDDLRDAGGNTVLLPTTYREAYELLASRGFEPLTPTGRRPFTADMQEEDLIRVPWGNVQVTKWVDTHHLHPDFLRGSPDPGRLVQQPG